MSSTIDDLIQKDYERVQSYTAEKERNEQLKRAERNYYVKKMYIKFNEQFSKISSNSFAPTATQIMKDKALAPAVVVPLTESSKAGVFKLSVIEPNGLYAPPSPPLSTEKKRDHWVEVHEDEIMDFWLPSRECLTERRSGKRHEFYTPSTIVPGNDNTLLYPLSAQSTRSSFEPLADVPLLKESHSTSTVASVTSDDNALPQ